ncbi:hypothetical protein CRUP_010676 [Coryphaenoides rupestris]|nr:hypothetical protein CRUP_010676 [Coryphaenoides rupestris]
MVVEDGPGCVVDGPEEEEELDLKARMAEDPGGERGKGVEAEMETVAAGSEEPPGAENQAAGRSWKWSVIYLCVYGFMASIKPGEPFITPYLLSTEKNFTREQVTNQITPVLSYSYMVVLVPVFLLTDFLRYKPVLVLQSLSQVSIWLLLLLGSSLAHMQLMEVFYGVTMAARLLPVPTVAWLGRLRQLGAVGARRAAFKLPATPEAAVSLGFERCCFQPSHNRRSSKQWRSDLATAEEDGTKAERDSMNPETGKPPSAPSAPSPPAASWRWCTLSWRESVFVQMLLEVRGVVRVPNLRLWCLWWVFNSTGYYLVLFYVHILWNKVYPATENKHVYNGGVEAVSTLLGAMTSFLAGFVKIRWNLWSELLIGVITALQAGLLLLMGTTTNIWVCYVAYTLFRGFYHFQIASSLTKELCALVFGINTFLGTIIKTIITLIIADRRGLGLDVHSQFFVYFFYFALLTVVYMVCAAVVITRHYRNHSSDLATPTELIPAAAVAEAHSDAEPLSNGKTTSA